MMNFSRRAAAALVILVRLYQYTVRPLMGSQCRFHPHCSAYAIEALETHGARRGVWLTLRRLLKCHPWHQGGVDHVPAMTIGQNAAPRRGPA